MAVHLPDSVRIGLAFLIGNRRTAVRKANRKLIKKKGDRGASRSVTKLQELNEPSLVGQQLLIIYLDGMVYGEHPSAGCSGGR